jgi:hypothetical protein
MHPNPVDLIQLWEDYEFMARCSKFWSHPPQDSLEIQGGQEFENPSQVPFRPSPQLVRIIHAHRRIRWGERWVSLVHIHLLLDLSWDELRKAICSVHAIMDNDWDGLWVTMILAPDPPLFPNLHFDSILWDLAIGSLRIVKQMIRGEVDTQVL